MPAPDRRARVKSLALRIAAVLRAGSGQRRRPPRRPDNPGSAAAPVTPDPAPRPLIGGAAAEID
ncbi:hypothetical protein KZ810_05935 [Sphingomonas sp. RHCKR47]|nr:hypothetical protein [Sphingomonas citricola]